VACLTTLSLTQTVWCRITGKYTMNWQRMCNYVLLHCNLRTGIEKNHDKPLEGQDSLYPASFPARHRSEAYRIFLNPVLSTLHKQVKRTTLIYIWRHVNGQDVDTADWSLNAALCRFHRGGHVGCYEDNNFWRMWWSSPSTSWFRSFVPFRVLKFKVKFPEFLRSSGNSFPFLLHNILSVNFLYAAGVEETRCERMCENISSQQRCGYVRCKNKFAEVWTANILI
jgi:hypothetical protein